MKSRLEVVSLPMFVEMRRGVQAAYVRLKELEKRQWGQSGTPGASYDTIGRTSDEIREARDAHDRLTRDYEAAVASAMSS